MQAGDLVFVRGRSIFSPLIRYFDRGNFSHVAIAVSSTHILEAQRFTDVRIVENNYTKANVEVVPMYFSKEETDDLLRWSISMCGNSYDYTQVFSYALKHYFETGVINNPNNVICSELVAGALLRYGRIKEAEGIFNVTPNELYEKIRKEAV